jgi:putative hydrolase of the HAD superfamily
MGENGIEAVIFDLGNVLISFDHTIAAKRIAPFTDKTEKEIFGLFFDSGITGLFEEGKISPQDFYLKVKEMLNLKLDYENFLPVWNEIFFLTAQNHSVYRIAKGLRGRYKTALLSNINVLHFDYLKQIFPLFDAFDCVLTSFELGRRKPDPLIYHRTIEALGVDSPAKVFYTDDRRELVEKASELGIRGFVFIGAEQLIEDLSKTGIDIKSEIRNPCLAGRQAKSETNPKL